MLYELNEQTWQEKASSRKSSQASSRALRPPFWSSGLRLSSWDVPGAQKTTKLDRTMLQAGSRPRPLPELSGHFLELWASLDLLRPPWTQLDTSKSHQDTKGPYHQKVGVSRWASDAIIKLSWIFLAFLRKRSGRGIPTLGTFPCPVSWTGVEFSRKTKKLTPGYKSSSFRFRITLWAL